MYKHTCNQCPKPVDPECTVYPNPVYPRCDIYPIPFMPINPIYAYAYVPYQTYTETYSPEEGLRRGTMFPEFVNVYNPNQCWRGEK